MPRGFKVHIEATGFLQRSGKHDKRSFMGFKAKEPSVLHELLYGEDISALRKFLFERGPHRCKNCGKEVTEETGEMDHILGGQSERCDCPHNVQILCHPCHEKKHNRFPKWSKKA